MFTLRSTILFCLVLLFGSCVSKSKFADLQREQTFLLEQIAEAEARRNQLSEEKAQMAMIHRQLNEELDFIQSKFQKTQVELSSLEVALKDYERYVEEKSKAHKVVLTSENQINEISNEDYYSHATSINFNSSSAQVTGEDRAYLKTIANQIKSNPHVTYSIVGHADNRPMKPNPWFKDNLDLSEKRGQAVVNVLVEYGVNPDQLVVIGKSDSEPLVDGLFMDTQSLAKNRRVEIVPYEDVADGSHLDSVGSVSLSPSLF